MNALTHPQARALADAFTENNPVPWKRQVPITDIQKLTAAIKDGAHIPLDDLILFLYAAQEIVADHPAMLWLEKETPESLADALMKAQWLSGEGPRPLSMSGPLVLDGERRGV